MAIPLGFLRNSRLAGVSAIFALALALASGAAQAVPVPSSLTIDAAVGWNPVGVDVPLPAPFGQVNDENSIAALGGATQTGEARLTSGGVLSTNSIGAAGTTTGTNPLAGGFTMLDDALGLEATLSGGTGSQAGLEGHYGVKISNASSETFAFVFQLVFEGTGLSITEFGGYSAILDIQSDSIVAFGAPLPAGQIFDGRINDISGFSVSTPAGFTSGDLFSVTLGAGAMATITGDYDLFGDASLFPGTYAATFNHSIMLTDILDSTGTSIRSAPPPPPGPIAMPEPSTLALFGLALLGLGLVRRRQNSCRSDESALKAV